LVFPELQAAQKHIRHEAIQVDLYGQLTLLVNGWILSVGVGRIFSTGAKSGEICFFPLKTKTTTFLAENFKIKGGPRPP